MCIILKNEQIRSVNDRAIAVQNFQGQIKVMSGLTPKKSHSRETEEKRPLPCRENPVKIRSAVLREF